MQDYYKQCRRIPKPASVLVLGSVNHRQLCLACVCHIPTKIPPPAGTKVSRILAHRAGKWPLHVLKCHVFWNTSTHVVGIRTRHSIIGSLTVSDSTILEKVASNTRTYTSHPTQPQQLAGYCSAQGMVQIYQYHQESHTPVPYSYL